MSLFYPRRGFVKATQGFSLRAGGGQLQEKYQNRTPLKFATIHQELLFFGQRRFVCVFDCSFSSISSAATQPQHWWCLQAGRVIQGHSEADGKYQLPFASPRTSLLTAKESGSSGLLCWSLWAQSNCFWACVVSYHLGGGGTPLALFIHISMGLLCSRTVSDWLELKYFSFVMEGDSSQSCTHRHTHTFLHLANWWCPTNIA